MIEIIQQILNQNITLPIVILTVVVYFPVKYLLIKKDFTLTEILADMATYFIYGLVAYFGVLTIKLTLLIMLASIALSLILKLNFDLGFRGRRKRNG